MMRLTAVAEQQLGADAEHRLGEALLRTEAPLRTLIEPLPGFIREGGIDPG